MNPPPAPVTRRHGARRPPRQTGHNDEGAITAFVVIAIAGLLLVAGLVLDGGTALAARSRAIGIAEEAARTGCQQLDLTTFRSSGQLRIDQPAAERAARDYLAAAGATGTVTATPGVVTVSATLRAHTQLLGVIGISEFDVTGIGAARPAVPA